MSQQPVELILLKQWASYISVPIFLIDAGGMLAFFNEPAEILLGCRFDDAGEMRVEEVQGLFKVSAVDGSEIPPEKIPLAIAFFEKRPAHMRLRFTALDGASRIIDVTAFPIEGYAQRHLGAVSMFWEPET